MTLDLGCGPTTGDARGPAPAPAVTLPGRQGAPCRVRAQSGMKCSRASQLCVPGKRLASLSLDGCIGKAGATSAPTLTVLGERKTPLCLLLPAS